jgi:uncharacterized protein YndB with AHSA1/START domain
MDWEISLARTLDAPCAQVFDAWTKAEHVSQWFAPKGVSVPACDLDFREGGAWNLCMRVPGMGDHWMHMVYREILTPQRIVFAGTLTGQPKGHQVLTIVTLAPEKTRTRTKVVQWYTGFAEKLAAEQGWRSTLDNLAAFVAQTTKKAARKNSAASRHAKRPTSSHPNHHG